MNSRPCPSPVCQDRLWRGSGRRVVHCLPPLHPLEGLSPPHHLVSLSLSLSLNVQSCTAKQKKSLFNFFWDCNIHVHWDMCKTISVTDSSDGQFLLTEAAEALPPWLEPEQAENRARRLSLKKYWTSRVSFFFLWKIIGLYSSGSTSSDPSSAPFLCSSPLAHSSLRLHRISHLSNGCSTRDPVLYPSETSRVPSETL